MAYVTLNMHLQKVKIKYQVQKDQWGTYIYVNIHMKWVVQELDAVTKYSYKEEYENHYFPLSKQKQHRGEKSYINYSFIPGFPNSLTSSNKNSQER